MVQPYYYRNKLQYPVGLDKNKEIVMGVFAKRTHEIIPVSKCMIQNEKQKKLQNIFLNLLSNTIYHHIMKKIRQEKNKAHCYKNRN